MEAGVGVQWRSARRRGSASACTSHGGGRRGCIMEAGVGVPSRRSAWHAPWRPAQARCGRSPVSDSWRGSHVLGDMQLPLYLRGVGDIGDHHKRSILGSWWNNKINPSPPI
jgi:hypothetical protein